MYHQLASSVGKLNLCFAIYLSLKKGCMVWTRSMATSLGHQESGNASSHPNRTHQSAPIVQPPFVQQMQSMAATMAELTRQNQELTWRSINVMNSEWKGKLRVKKLEKEKMLSTKTIQGVLLHVGCHTWKRRWIKWGEPWTKWGKIWEGRIM